MGFSLLDNYHWSHRTYGSRKAIRAFMRSAEINGWYPFHLDLPLNLRSITISIGVSDFEVIEPRHVWEDNLGEADFQTVMLERQWNKLSGLRAVHIRPGWCHRANTPSKKEIWKRDVARFETFLRTYATLPKPNARHPEPTSQILLYDGSGVYLNSVAELESSSSSAFLEHHAKRYEDATEKRKRSSSVSEQMSIASLMNESNECMDYERQPFNNGDIPDDLQQFKALLELEGNRVMAWIRNAKRKAV